MLKNSLTWRGRRWQLVLIGVAVGAAGVTAYRVQLAVRRQLPAYVKFRLEQALRRPVRVGAIEAWPPGAFTICGLDVLPGPGETRSPLHARRARVEVAWWDLVARGRLRIRAICLEKPRACLNIDLRRLRPDQPTPNARVLSLAAFGVDSICVDEADLDLLATLPDNSTRRLVARGLSGELGVAGERFTYTSRAREWQSGDLRLADLSVAGDGDRRTTRVADAALSYQGGTVRARGSYREGSQRIAAEVAVTDVPLAELAGRMGLPSTWKLAGRLTGTVSLDAESGAIRRVRGQLTANAGELCAAGMSQEFRWNTAAANLDWSRQGMTLRNLRVRGDGIELAGTAVLTGSPEEMATRATYRAHGLVQIVGSRAVERVGELLAFHSSLGGGWRAGGARFEFDASGPVGRMAETAASGSFAIADLSIHPAGAPAPIAVRRVAGQFRRSPAEIQLASLSVDAGGVEGTGSIRVTNPLADTRPDANVRFEADGRVRVTDTSALQRLLPHAAVWRWLDSRSAGSGQFAFHASGPVRELSAVRAEGEFSLRNTCFLLPGIGSGTAASERFEPVVLKTASGRFAHDNQTLQIRDVALTTGDLQARGAATIASLAGPDPVVTVEGRVRGTRWETLPGVTERITRRLRGGDYSARISMTTPLSRLPGAVVTGDFTLEHARLVWPGVTGGAADRARAVDSVTARYVREGDVLRLADIRLRGDGLSASGSAVVRAPLSPDPEVSLKAEARVDRWERLPSVPPAVRRFLNGGRLTAQVNMTGPMSHLEAQPASGAFQLRGAQLTWDGPGGRTVAQPVEVLSGHFRCKDRAADLSELHLDAGTFHAAGELQLSQQDPSDPSIALKARALLDDWQRLPGVPAAVAARVRGGRIVASVSCVSPLSRLAEAALRGDARITGARFVSDGVANGLAIREASARFARENGALQLSEVRVEGEAFRGAGQLRFASTSDADSALDADLSFEAANLERLAEQFEQPLAALRGGRVALRLSGHGTLQQLPQGEWTGDLRLSDATLLAGEGDTKQSPLAVQSLTTTFSHRAGRWRLPDVRVRTALGALDGAGEVVDGTDAAAPAFRFGGSVASDAAAALLNRCGPLPAARGGILAATFTAAGRMDDLAGADVVGSTQIRDGWLDPQPPPGKAAAPVAVKSVRTDFRRSGAQVRLDNFAAVLDTCSLTGSGTIDHFAEGTTARLSASVKVASEQWQRMLGMDQGWDGVVGGKLTLASSLDGPLATVSLGRGQFVLEEARLRMPDTTETLPVTRLAGSYRSEQDVLFLEDLRLASPVGSAVGRGEIHGTGARATHRFQARWETSEPLALIRPLVSVPGALKGGRLSGSLTIQGGASEPVAHLEGDFMLARARYLPPGAAGSQLPAIPITAMSGSFHKEGDRTRLTGVSLVSPALSAAGGVEFLPDDRGDGGMLVHSHLQVADLGRFLSYWPLLRKKVDGGSVTADLTLRGDVSEWSRTTGSGTIEARGGRFTIPAAEAPFARATFEPLTAQIAWDGDAMKISALSLRGDKYNVDCSGSIRYAGRIDVSGSAWLTHAFGKSLMPKGLTGLVGHILGLMPKQVDSTFRLAGSLDRPMLALGITRAPVWKYARRSIAPPILRVAIGRDPVWDLSAGSRQPSASSEVPGEGDGE